MERSKIRTGAWLERVVAPVLLKEGYVRTYVCVRAYPLRLEHAGFNATWAGACIPDARSLALGLALINGRAGQAANHRHPTQPLYNFRCSAAGSERIASDHFQILTKIKKSGVLQILGESRHRSISIPLASKRKTTKYTGVVLLYILEQKPSKCFGLPQNGVRPNPCLSTPGQASHRWTHGSCCPSKVPTSLL